MALGRIMYVFQEAHRGVHNTLDVQKAFPLGISRNCCGANNTIFFFLKNPKYICYFFYF